MRFDAGDFPNDMLDAIADRIADRIAARLAPPPPADEVFDTADAAAYLKLSKQQLEIWRSRGGGPPFLKLDRRVRYRRNELDAWMNQRKRNSTSELAR